ncbi:MAG TPA: GWxTD domain-containing protein [Gemmatimonadaceae bacterium]|nr:GWxTD domain-containing protein [Gemmatimonadaceae bacterium]
MSLLRHFRALALGLSVVACASRPAPPPSAGAIGPNASSPRRAPVQPDAVSLYRRMGLLADAGDTPFVGSLAFFAGPRFDSATVVLTVSLANRFLRFVREGDRFRATYHVNLEIRRGGDLVREIRAAETVRVLAFRETTREDESVLFRQLLNLAPGTYEFRLTVRDEAAAKGSAVEATVGVPRFGIGSLSSPVAYYEATPRAQLDSTPRFLASPRSTAIFGRDSLLQFYVEAYGEGAEFPVAITVESEGSEGVVWSDTVSLPRRRDLFSGTFGVPVGQLGVGVMTLGVARLGGQDTLRVPLFVAFGEDLPVASFPEMLDYLRYFATPERLQKMREAKGEQRAALWAAFLRETDPVPQTPQHEALLQYFARIAQANARYREEGIPGWLTDRGRVAVALGEPDQRYEPSFAEVGQRGRTQIWEYRQHRLQLVFVDQTGFGRWRLTLASEADFESVVRRLLVG